MDIPVEFDSRILMLHPTDNVAVVVDGIRAGGMLEGGMVATVDVPRGHKVAVRKIASGEAIRKYGQIIGFATGDILPGNHVHTHNCAMGDFDRDVAFGRDIPELERVTADRRLTFEGFRRATGRVGTRNYIGVLTSVNCAGSVARFIAQSVERAGLLERYPGVDGIVPIVHGTGCGMTGKGDGYDNLSRVLWSYAGHPNFAGVLMVGLGCEVFQIPRFLDDYGMAESETFRVMTIQDSGGTRKTVERGHAMIEEMLPLAAQSERETVPASELTLALQCGGSDGYSGITANPALGHCVDLLVAQGGTAILSETPEIFGAEHLLTRRAANQEIGEKLVDLIGWWEDYTKRTGSEMDSNPSPGNKAGGLTTILEKSLGAAAKGGTTALNGVYRYGERIDATGLVFMDSPGYDPASVTGQVAAGATMVCFSTGRGSVFGYKPAPSIKLATNTPLYDRMAEDMDINCGTIVDGDSTVQEKGKEILDHVLAVASGQPSKSEAFGFGDAEFVPWQIGAVM